MDLGLGLFYYTLIVLLAVILTAATCLASYLVTRNKTYRYAFAGFLFYFFDVALVFQDDFLMQRASDASVSPFFIGSPVAPSSSAAARSYRSGSCCASTWRRIGRRYAGSRVRRSC